MLLNRTVWSFIAGLLTGLTIFHFMASSERCLYDGENNDGRNALSVDAQAISKRQTTLALEALQHPQLDLHNDLADGRIPAKGTFLSLLNIKIVSLVMEMIQHHIAFLYKNKNNNNKLHYRSTDLTYVMCNSLERISKDHIMVEWCFANGRQW